MNQETVGKWKAWCGYQTPSYEYLNDQDKNETPTDVRRKGTKLK